MSENNNNTMSSMLDSLEILAESPDDGKIVLAFGDLPQQLDTWLDDAESTLSEVDTTLGDLTELREDMARAVEAAGDAKDDAETQAANAEAWAVGTRGGTDVSTEDETYHNNSKYYAEQTSTGVAAAAASASAAATSAGAAAGSASDAASSANESAVSAAAASASATAASSSQTSAASSATAAAASQAAASTSATSASNSAASASSSATSASGSATAAAASASAAAQSAQDAEDVLDSIPPDYTAMTEDVSALKSAIDDIAKHGTYTEPDTLTAEYFENGVWNGSGIKEAASYRVRTIKPWKLSAGQTINVNIGSGYKATCRVFGTKPDGETTVSQIAGSTSWETNNISFTATQECWAVVSIGEANDASLSVETALQNVSVSVPMAVKTHSENRINLIVQDIDGLDEEIDALRDVMATLETEYQNLYNPSTMLVSNNKAYDKTGTIEGNAVNLIDLNNYTAIKIPIPSGATNIALKMAGYCQLWGWYAVDDNMIITSAYGSRLSGVLLNEGYVCENIPSTATYLCLSVLYYANCATADNDLMAVPGTTAADYLPYITPWAEIENLRANVLPPIQRQIDWNTSHRQWMGKNWSQYGDSISTYAFFPSADDGGWAVIPNNYHKFSESYMRGIGGQSFAYGPHGGSVAFINADGSLHSVNQTTNYDDYSGTVPSGTTKSRGAFCSWLRITSMFPASMKDNVDLVLIMGGTNDAANSTAPTWVENSTTDAEWAASEYYSDYGGDYNINTLQGGVASTIMKMHAWMPNALIVIGTPLNGRTDVTGEKKPGTIPTEYEKANQIIEAARMFGTNVIDVFGGCGINVANSDEYIGDGVHPNSEGRKLLGSFIAGELNRIMPLV